jgi:uncharacterized membrane protein
MKKYFITGLVILLPLALTIAIVIFLFNLLTEPFAGILKAIFSHYGFFQNGFLFFTSDQIQQAISQLLILVLLVCVTIGLGILARWFFVHYLIRLSETLFHRIPFINTVYKTCNDVIKTIFATKNKSFKQVVMVRFPNPETYSIGLVTREDLPNVKESSPGQESKLIAVFVPTTPNPTSGFLIMYKPEDVIHLDMKVEDAFKYVISCGVIISPFKAISKEAALLRAEAAEDKELIE